MKWILVIFCLFFTWQSMAQTNTVSSTSSTVSGTTTVDRTPSTASAPSVVINNQDVCSFAASAAIQTQILGLAGGTAIRDLNCERLKLSRALFRMGMKVGAVAMLCQDARIFQAMEMAGTPCPYMGKIGLEAAQEWANNPEKRPDYDEWLKVNDVKEEEFLSDDTTAFGIFSVLFLLLLL
ncbi:MAG: hypothetical protein Tp1124SUR272871_54 [Prokaryotic dsDNA virus sp.]|nr:MAG: hypothetical protein Tp1125SUR00d2C35834131_40 [Prokaryotic dsDNA virus sp.]QDP67374.1 MAG: hypothetical protein Tp1124SUR272871_54 [Prokaryotic dsDNA virus sp.]|tara:strand:+ start:272 stop:811 length:540 start_codon:yes stop_codon:yes gene_type:complete